METTAMIRLLEREADSPFTPIMLLPHPQFQRRWLIKMAAVFHESDGLPIPKPMLGDPFAREVLLNKHGIRV